MLAQYHMFQRNHIWYWRRKVRRLSTETLDMQLSLLTTNRQQAVIIARCVTAESDVVVEALKQEKISIEEARAFLRNVILRETERLERQRMVIAMDSGPGRPEDDDRHDWAQKTAWGLLARQGIRAAVDPRLGKQHRMPTLSDQTTVTRLDRGLGLAVNFELPVKVAHMGLHGGQRNPHFHRGLLVG